MVGDHGSRGRRVDQGPSPGPSGSGPSGVGSRNGRDRVRPRSGLGQELVKTLEPGAAGAYLATGPAVVPRAFPRQRRRTT
ncbi:hypothetical protein [Ornithinimicrobium kibberense]|uniref:hypothetical protein n=1 Tax=Ornithinimicrobium kibberense TaxID=282060 RepID=UPI003611B5EF